MNMLRPSYRDYVAAQSRRNPCLISLLDFLSQPRKLPDYGSRIYCFEHTVTDSRPHGTDVTDLRSLLMEENINRGLKGRTLIIEDPDREIVETLGTVLDLDPFFFASHFSRPLTRSDYQHPVFASLPSRIWTRSFINIDYHLVLSFSGPMQERKFVHKANIPRQIMRLPLRGENIGLARGCISVLRKRVPGQPWLCLILVDAPIRNTFVIGGKSILSGDDIIMLDHKRYQGGTGDFTDTPSYSTYLHHSPQPKKPSIFDDLLCDMQMSPPGFEVNDPNLLPLVCSPLKLVIMEWMIYTTLMSQCVKNYEYSIRSLHLRLQDTEALDADLRDLQKWRRRGRKSLHKLHTATEFIKYWSTREAEPKTDAWDFMIKDINYITGQVEGHTRQLEAMVPVVTSLVQILDSRRSFLEASNIKQLTYVALIFVPLTFVASLFSMSDRYTPGANGFWIYFIVALPLSMLVLAVARFPLGDMTRALNYLRLKWIDVKTSARRWLDGEKQRPIAYA